MDSRTPTDREHEIQESQYEFPYHHVPQWTEESFFPFRLWTWSDRYIGGLTVVLDQLKEISFESLLDVGCGDGRFLREVRNHYPRAHLTGVDVSARAIGFARAFTPEVDFVCQDVTRVEGSEKVDVATCVEVLEHIPPDAVSGFLDGLVGRVRRDGYLIFTVPHSNRTVSAKHYQHFSTRTLRSVLEPHMDVECVIPFDMHSKLVSAARRMLWGRGRYFVITHRRLLRAYLTWYTRHYLYGDDEGRASRVAAVCRPR